MNFAVIVLADADSHADLGRVVTAMMIAREAMESGDELRLIFDGAGTRWIEVLADPDHRSHTLFSSIRDQITGACKYCAKAFGVTEAVEVAGVPLLDEYRQHPSIRTLAHDGFQVLVF